MSLDLLEENRKEAEMFLPKVKEIFKDIKDPLFIQFIQKVFDDYMLNNCQLDRRKIGKD